MFNKMKEETDQNVWSERFKIKRWRGEKTALLEDI